MGRDNTEESPYAYPKISVEVLLTNVRWRRMLCREVLDYQLELLQVIIMISPTYYVSKGSIYTNMVKSVFFQKEVGILYLAYSGKSALFLQKTNHKRDYKF